MKLLLKSFFFLVVMVLSASCISNKNIVGKYRSNFAQYGFFVTEIKLNCDSTAEYHMAGDMINENLTGHFKITNNIVYFKSDKLKYIEPKQTFPLNDFTLIDTIESKNYHHYDLKVENNTSYHLKFKIKSKKLLVYDNKTNKMIRVCQGSKKKAKYYLKKLETN